MNSLQERGFSDNKVGQLVPAKGLVDGLKVTSLDAIQECPKEECVAFHACNYIKQGPCKVRKYFILAVHSAYLNTLKEPNEVDLMRIGSLLVPLWDQLCRFKIEEMSITATMMMKGYRIHPIFKAVRETIKAIVQMEYQIGIERKCIGGNVSGKFPNFDDFMHGDPDYYESLLKSDKEEEPDI